MDWTQKTLAPRFQFPVLWVLAYGDFTSGEIHRACDGPTTGTSFVTAWRSGSFTP